MKPSFDDLITLLGTKRGQKSSNNLDQALAHFHFPNKAFTSIHVAGTNGKGSVSVKIAKGLELAKKKVGLFTSPHIETFCERIQINGELIPEDEVLEYMEEIHPFSLTFFETAFVIACLYFAKKGVEYAVIEAGIGGKLDSTNCLLSDCSVITSIGYDHTELLGDTLEEIAQQKAGIIKPGHNVFIGPTANFPMMYSTDWTTTLVSKDEHWEAQNCALADAVLAYYGVEEDVRNEALEAGMPCRFESIGSWIFDIAHNPAGIEALVSRLNKKSTFYIGFSKTKDVKECLGILRPYAHKIVAIPTKRSELHSQDELKNMCPEAICPLSLEELLEQSHDETHPQVVCGSAYVMEPLRKIIRLKNFVK